MNMYNWVEQTIYTERKKALPILSFPAVQYLYLTVRELVADSNHLAVGMRLIADNFDMPAAFKLYGSVRRKRKRSALTRYIKLTRFPTIIGKLIATEEDADALEIPKIGAGRTGENIEAIRKAQMLITDRPRFRTMYRPVFTGRPTDECQRHHARLL